MSVGSTCSTPSVMTQIIQSVTKPEAQAEPSSPKTVADVIDTVTKTIAQEASQVGASEQGRGTLLDLKA